MATSLHSLSSSFSLSTSSSSSSSSSSFPFQFPKNPFQISCFSSKKPVFNVGPSVSVCGQRSFKAHDAASPLKKLPLGRDLIVPKASEVVAANSEEGAATQPKSSKKAKKIKYPRRILDVYQILQVPIITEAAIKNIADENSLLFTVDVRADKKMIREAISNFFGVKVRKVNTLIRPDGTKKAYIMLSKEYNASELAKKIGIFPRSG